jgi:hypothetical protein
VRRGTGSQAGRVAVVATLAAAVAVLAPSGGLGPRAAAQDPAQGRGAGPTAPQDVAPGGGSSATEPSPQADDGAAGGRGHGGMTVGTAARARVAGDEGDRDAAGDEGRTGAPEPATVPDGADAGASTAYAPPPGTTAGAVALGRGVHAGLEVFGRYGVTLRDTSDGADWFHAFDVPRVHAAIEGQLEDARGRVVVEAVRSAAEGALIGVAGDSLVLRLREAWAGYSLLDRALEVRIGVIPLLTVPAVESTWGLRAVTPVPLEETGLAAPADLGARATVTLPARLGWVGVAGFAGDGYTSRELNRGKSTEAALELHPLAPVADALAPLALFVSGVHGSQGVRSVRTHRLTAGLLWRPAGGPPRDAGARLAAGLLATFAFGLDDDAAREATLLEAFVRAEPVDRLLLGARLSHFVRATDVPGDRLTSVVVTAGYRLAEPLTVLLAVTRGLPASRARAALPGSDLWDVGVVGRIAY